MTLGETIYANLINKVYVDDLSKATELDLTQLAECAIFAARVYKEALGPHYTTVT